MRLTARYSVAAAPPIMKPQPFSVGVFCLRRNFVFSSDRASSRVLLGGSCKSLRTSPVSLSACFGLLSTLSRPFFSPAQFSQSRPKSAKATSQPVMINVKTRPHSATPFRALLLSDPVLPKSPEVRKGHDRIRYESIAYARTNQAVGLRHWLPKGGIPIGGWSVDGRTVVPWVFVACTTGPSKI